MFFLLNHIIYNFFITVKFLITNSFNIKIYIIFLTYLIEKDGENSFYNNIIMKYIIYFYIFEFDNLIYFKYFKKYTIFLL